jgi:cytochrome c
VPPHAWCDHAGLRSSRRGTPIHGAEEEMMCRKRFVPVMGCLALAACAPSLGQGNAAPAGAAGDAEQGASQQDVAPGERVFQRVCSACHSLESPARAAPPMTHVARHYRQSFTDPAAAVEHIVEFVRSPAAERSMLPAHARERWGLMPPLPLPEAELRAVAAYIWQLPEPQRGMGGHHRRQGARRGAASDRR